MVGKTQSFQGLVQGPRTTVNVVSDRTLDVCRMWFKLDLDSLRVDISYACETEATTSFRSHTAVPTRCCLLVLIRGLLVTKDSWSERSIAADICVGWNRGLSLCAPPRSLRLHCLRTTLGNLGPTQCYKAVMELLILLCVGFLS
jgi:hypothetical protein